MKYTIMMRMLFMLLAKKRITAKEVAEKFEIAPRSVYRYVDELTLAHVPVVTERGVGGGIMLSETFKLPASFFTREEHAKLLELIGGMPQLKEDEVFASIVEKLLAIKKDGRDETPSLRSASLIIDGSGWNDLAFYNEKFSLVSKAINETTALKITYHDRNGRITKREIEPHAIVLKHGIFYVYAYCRKRKDFRLFKLGRIEYAALSDKFVRKPFDHENPPFNEWFKSVEREEVELIVDPSIRSDVEEWLGVESVTELPSGSIRAICRLPYDDSLISEIMKYGKKIKVARPEKLKRDILENALGLVEIYSK